MEEFMVQQNIQVRVNPADETIQVGVTQIRFLITGAESNDSVATLELSIPAGARFPAPPHSHDAYEETLYGLEGVSTWTINGVSIELKPGQTVCVPRGVIHGFSNPGTVDAKVLTIMSPATIGPEFFREMAAVVNAAAGGPPDRSKMVEIMKRYGLTPASPPPA
jgi:quercetin dioxygenase-like cupin family protein